MAPPPACEHSGAMSETTTEPIATKRLERPASGRMLAGVAAGLGRYFDLNPTFFRLGFVVLTLLGGSGVLLYLAALLIIPEEGKHDSIAGQSLAERRERPGRLVGLGLAGIALLVLITHASFWPAAGAGWVLILVAGLVILWMYDSRRGDRRRRRIVTTLVVLCALALATLAAALITALAWFHVSPGAGVGDRYETPSGYAALHSSYHQGVGKLQLDLSKLPPAASETHVKARVDIGELRVIVPQTANVSVNAHAKVGAVHALGQDQSGHDASIETGSGLLVIDATVGAGRIDVVRAEG